MSKSHWVAILQALLVTFLWSTSWVFIKIGLNDEQIPSVTFAALRYTVAFLCLLAFSWQTGKLAPIKTLERQDWMWLTMLGVVYYTITQGTQYIALDYLPAVTLSLLLNFSAVMIAFMGIWLLKEYPTPMQWLGTAIFIGGVLIYFYPVQLPQNTVKGLLIGFIGVAANAVAGIQGRHLNHHRNLDPYTVTLVSMGIGTTLMLIWGVGSQGLPAISLKGWAIITWLAVVNTAFTFPLWNHTLKTLSAVESGVINNTMLIQIAILALIFLDESISLQEGIGMVIAAVGILMVQIMRAKPALVEDPST